MRSAPTGTYLTFTACHCAMPAQCPSWLSYWMDSPRFQLTNLNGPVPITPCPASKDAVVAFNEAFRERIGTLARSDISSGAVSWVSIQSRCVVTGSQVLICLVDATRIDWLFGIQED